MKLRRSPFEIVINSSKVIKMVGGAIGEGVWRRGVKFESCKLVIYGQI